MAYTYNPTTWHTGDIITEGKLNNIENGIKGLYPTREVILPPQEITIESDTPLTGVEIQLPTGVTINNDVWASGGYIITVSTAPDSEPLPSREVLFHIDMGGGEFGNIPYEAYVGDSETTESTYNCVIKRDVVNNVLTFMALRWSSEISYAWPGTYTVSIIQPGFINLPYVAVPKLLVDVEHQFINYGLFAVIDEKQTTVKMINQDCFDSLCAVLSMGSLQFVQRKSFDMVYPISGELEDQGFYLNEPCLGLIFDIGDGDFLAFIPDNVDYRYWESAGPI